MSTELDGAEVVELEMHDGSKPRWAIQLETGAFYGQSWDDCTCKPVVGARRYPIWKTRRGAEAELRKLRKECDDIRVDDRAHRGARHQNLEG